MINILTSAYIFLMISALYAFPGSLERGTPSTQTGFTNFQHGADYPRGALPKRRFIIDSGDNYVPSPQTLTEVQRDLYMPLEIVSKQDSPKHEDSISGFTYDNGNGKNVNYSTYSNAQVRDPKNIVKFKESRNDNSMKVIEQQDLTTASLYILSANNPIQTQQAVYKLFNYSETQNHNSPKEISKLSSQIKQHDIQQELKQGQETIVRRDFVIPLSNQNNYTLEGIRAPKNDSIIFIDEREKAPPGKIYFNLTFDTRGPTCANESTFCENPDIFYPKDHISGILKNGLTNFKELFEYDANVEERLDINTRLKDREEELCRTHDMVVFPKIGKTIHDRWQFIANTDEIKQGVRVELCDFPDGECNFSNAFPYEYSTTCTQKYVTRKMLSLTDNGEAGSEDFLFPSCCSCSIKHKSDVDSRISKTSTMKDNSHT